MTDSMGRRLHGVATDPSLRGLGGRAGQTCGRTRGSGPPPITEKEFQRQVLDLARIYRWRAYHPFLSKWSERGFPDLTLVRPPRIIFAELKRDGGRLTGPQQEWSDLLTACPGVEFYVWRPGVFDVIAEVLA